MSARLESNLQPTDQRIAQTAEFTIAFTCFVGFIKEEPSPRGSPRTPRAGL